MTPDDQNFERIGRYLDGEMEAEEQALFEAEMERNHALAAQVEQLAANDDRLRAAFDLPIDDALLARLGLVETVATIEPTADLIDFNAARQRRDAAKTNPVAPPARPWRWAIGGAMAAALVTVIAIPAMMARPNDPTRGDRFQVAMESLPSGQRLVADGQTSIAPTLSFTDRGGRFCREFALTGSSPEVGVSCRNSGGIWQVEGRSAAGASASDSGEIRTAAGDNSAALDAIYNRLGASDPLDAASEQRLLAARWTSSGR